jgi:alkylhydroperoxidase/carboxymuconolactone decarboxylase family protein YurZ
VSPKDHQRSLSDAGDEWVFPFEAELHAFAPAMHDAQNAWLAQIDSLTTPDRKTHELIRMVCMVIQRNAPGVSLHAMLAAEVGATWEEVAGSIMLTEPSFGLLGAAEALPPARTGWEKGRRKKPRSAAADDDPATSGGKPKVKATSNGAPKKPAKKVSQPKK